MNPHKAEDDRIVSLTAAGAQGASEGKSSGTGDATKAPSRLDRWLQLLSHHIASGHPDLATIFIDIDRSRQLSAEFGLQGLKALFDHIEERLQSFAEDRRASGITHVARIKDDVFAFLVKGASDTSFLMALSEQILAVLDRPVMLEDRAVAVTASAGVAIVGPHGQSAEEITNAGQRALMTAKSIGRRSKALAPDRTALMGESRIALEHDIQLGLMRDEFNLHYQPQIDIETGLVIGAEALLRWNHPTRGIVAPNMFMDVLQDIGALPALGQTLVEHACEQSARWCRAFKLLKISVNVSPVQFDQRNFASRFLDIAQTCGVERGGLELEITESVAMRDPARASAELSPLRNSGIRLAMDDFGTGYSNLSSLSRLPFDTLKIDRSFVRDCARDGTARIVVATIISMAHNLGFETIAEGVETHDQRTFIASLGCKTAQGFLWSKALAPDDFEGFCKQRGVKSPAAVM